MTAYVPHKSEKDPQKIIRSLRELASGRSNGIGVVTLAASAASTSVIDPNCATGSVIVPIPATAHAAAEWGNGTLYIPAATVINGSFVIQHANNSQTDRTFAYAIIG